MNPILSRSEDERPFTATRVVKPGYSTVTAPRVVSCHWSTLNTNNIYAPTMTQEEMDKNVGCTKHYKCKGHLRMDPSRSTYMIPHGFATADELRSSDSYVFNKMIMEGKKTSADMAQFCFDKVSGKRGLLRKSCNGTRPTNTMRFVASPSKGPKNAVYLPPHVFEKAQFVHVYANGRCVMKKLKVGQTVLFGRCPAQGAESELPFVALKGPEGSSSIKISLETCPRNNADFDGDEMFGVVAASEASQKELDDSLAEAWDGVEDILGGVSRIVNDSGGDSTVDPAMYSTMPLEDMEEHPGGKMYELLMLKPKSWSVMCKAMHSSSYWRSWVSRSEQGIVNTIMGRHGIAGPYGYMRLGMMLGTCVDISSGKVVINSMPRPDIPCVDAIPGLGRITCASAMTKMTRVLYQKGIDMSKHGKAVGLLPAMETLMKMSSNYYTIMRSDGGFNIVLSSDGGSNSSTNPCTTLDWICSRGTNSELIEAAVLVTSMVEEIDNVKLSTQERIAASVLIAFLAMNLRAVMEEDVMAVVRPLGLDWYTSVTCSDIRWIKNEIRSPKGGAHVRLDTNISSTLGAIFLGNMSMIVPGNTGEHGDGTIKMNTESEVLDWASDY